MKRSVIIACILLCLCITLFSSYYVIHLKSENISTASKKSQEAKPEYHFVVIAQSTDDPYWQSIRNGSQAAAEQYNVVAEFNGPRSTNIDEELQYLDIAIACRVDGIATHVLDEKRFTPLINKAIDKKIPVVTIENDAKDSKRISFICTNGYKLGSEAGKLLVKATGGEATAAIILNGYNENEENVAHNLRIAGFNDAVREFPGIALKTAKTTGNGFFSAEEVTKTILQDFPDVDAIMCTSSMDTIGVAQVVVDLNRVGTITIVGNDDTPEVLRYVENDVICGTVVGNPYKTGFETVKALVELKKTRMTSSYIDTGVQVVTKSNLKDYALQAENEKENMARK
jgi:ribose transport system substrate-binding protein